ncbi:MAG: helix-turn-helix domain-containing protein [Paludibacteraceae bacterium]
MIDYFMTNDALLQYVGKQMRQMRINAQLSQKDLATQSGVTRSTLAALENGHGAKLETVISLLRTMQKLEILNGFETQALTSPLLVAKNAGRTPKRIYKKRQK